MSTFFSKIELFSFKTHFLNPRATPSTSASKSVYIWEKNFIIRILEKNKTIYNSQFSQRNIMVILYPPAEDRSLSAIQALYGTIVNQIFHFSVKIPNTVSLILLSFCLNELNKRAGLKSNNETLRCRYIWISALW